jgi:hypothetical protein
MTSRRISDNRHPRGHRRYTTMSSYNGQYPPLHPRSPADISSFTELHTSLRQSLPELAREGDKILNEEQLSKFVDGLVRFQKEHLGRVSYYNCSLIMLVFHQCLSLYTSIDMFWTIGFILLCLV